MSTTDDAHDASGTPHRQDRQVPADGRGRCVDATETRPRRMLDRISEAVRAAHAASVPF